MPPFISLILPIRNEAPFIAKTLASVFAQDYPPECMEVLVVDGASTDATREVVTRLISENPRLSVQLLDNPRLIVPTGMNIALREARGKIIIRVDGHCVIASDYVRRCVEHIQQDEVVGVGGPMVSIGETHLARVTALGMSSPFGVGNSAFRTTSGKTMFADTVPFPAYTREIIQQAGLYDEELVRNQDDEYNYRIRELGGRILLAEDVRSTYFSRTSLRGLWKQYFQYGFWKVRVLQKHPLQMSLRQFVPPAFVLALLASIFMAILAVLGVKFAGLSSPVLLVAACITPLLYLSVDLSASAITAARRGWKYLPLLPLVFAILHLSYGLGFLLGLVSFARRWGDRRGRVPEVPVATEVAPHGARVEFKPRAGLQYRLFLLIKRLSDILASSLGLLVLSPFLLIIAWSIRRESPGPVFYRGRRMGKGGRPFHILKFRTMFERPECHAGPGITAQDDDRITPLGHWLRDTKLNELPQLWNVLKGDMSVVGPRPEDFEIARSWPPEVQAEILSVRPGITSPASIIYRDEEKLLHSANVLDEYMQTVLPHKLRLDQLYVRNYGYISDLDLIFATLEAFLPKIGSSRYTPEALLAGRITRFFRRYLTWYMIDSLVAFAAISAAG
ncbi:MAG TPA: sugar transferase, partial [Anaerolineales bacterium]